MLSHEHVLHAAMIILEIAHLAAILICLTDGRYWPIMIERVAVLTDYSTTSPVGAFPRPMRRFRDQSVHVGYHIDGRNVKAEQTVEQRDTRSYEWAEPLPVGCPPAEAVPPDGSGFYRLVESNPPTIRDFYSHRQMKPSSKFSVSECMARACSLQSTYDDCANIKKLPRHRHKAIVRVTLPPESGLVMRTGKNRSLSRSVCTSAFSASLNAREGLERDLTADCSAGLARCRARYRALLGTPMTWHGALFMVAREIL